MNPPQTYIELSRFLKLAGLVQSGGEAKHLVQSNGVTVNGELELRRRRKLRAGDRVAVDGVEIAVSSIIELADVDAGNDPA